MIYRLLFCSFLGSVAVVLTGALFVCEELHAFNRDARRRETLVQKFLAAAFSARGLVVLTAAFGLAVAVLIGPGLWTRVTLGHVLVHWSRVVLAGLLTFTLCQFYVTRLIVTIVRLHVSRLRFHEQETLKSTLRSMTQRASTAPRMPIADAVVLT